MAFCVSSTREQETARGGFARATIVRSFDRFDICCLLTVRFLGKRLLLLSTKRLLKCISEPVVHAGRHRSHPLLQIRNSPGNCI